jgi:hypothetical protein
MMADTASETGRDGLSGQATSQLQDAATDESARGEPMDREPSLDGTWRVRRAGGLLPPMSGVRKHIGGSVGETAVGRLPGLRFDVVGNELRYRPPLAFLVDKVEPCGAGWIGTTLVAGRPIGRFHLERPT